MVFDSDTRVENGARGEMRKILGSDAAAKDAHGLRTEVRRVYRCAAASFCICFGRLSMSYGFSMNKSFGRSGSLAPR